MNGMKKLLTLILLVAASLYSYAQNWNTIRYKDLVSFQLPAGYSVQDTLGSKIYQSEIEDTTYIITLVDDTQPLLFTSEESITAFYNDFFDALVAKSNKPKVVSKEVVQFGNFKAFRALLERNVIKKELTWQILVLHVKNTTLTFQCLTQQKAKAQFERLEKSIEFNSELTSKDQISEAEAPKPNTNQYLQYILYTLAGLAVIYFFGKQVFFKKPKA
jgi:hypothetical protein